MIRIEDRATNAWESSSGPQVAASGPGQLDGQDDPAEVDAATTVMDRPVPAT